ncbi:MAG: DUF401 family protein [Planctomycetota bacterium]
MVILKISLLFLLIVLLLRLKIPFSISILITGFLLGIWFNLSIRGIGDSVVGALRAGETVSLVGIVGVILIFSELLQESGQLTALSKLIVETFGLHRLTYTILPVVVGLLPMPGGALFTAPLMDGVGDESIPAHKKTLINYWFRHIWEYAWPLYPGLVLAAGLAKVNLNTLSVFQSPFIIISFISGMLIIFPGIKIINTSSRHKFNFRGLIKMGYLLLPIGIIIISFLAVRLPMLISLLISLEWIILTALIKRQLGLKSILKVIFAKVHVYQMIFIVISVMVFSGILQSSTLTTDLSKFFNNGQGNQIPFIYMMLSVILLPLIVGLLTGMTVAFVGITFPIIFTTIIPNGMDILPMAMLAYVSGISGIMLSPLHLCLILTNQYYKSSLMKVYKYLVPIVLIVFISAIAICWLYFFLK